MVEFVPFLVEPPLPLKYASIPRVIRLVFPNSRIHEVYFFIAFPIPHCTCPNRKEWLRNTVTVLLSLKSFAAGEMELLSHLQTKSAISAMDTFGIRHFVVLVHGEEWKAENRNWEAATCLLVLSTKNRSWKKMGQRAGVFSALRSARGALIQRVRRSGSMPTISRSWASSSAT